MTQSFENQDTGFMKMAIEYAQKGAATGEVPVAAVLVQTHDIASGNPLIVPQVVSQSHNNRESAQNSVGHAELLVIEEASQKLGRWRLSGCTLYVTLEPCLMCAGAIVLSRVDRVVFGAVDPKAGACVSLYQVFSDSRLNHRPILEFGIETAACSKLLSDFFKEKRMVQAKFFSHHDLKDTVLPV